MKLFVLAGSLLLSSSAYAQSGLPERTPASSANTISQQEPTFENRLIELKSKYDDQIVSDGVSLAFTNQNAFFNKLKNGPFLTDHNPDWFLKFKQALSAFDEGHLEEAESLTNKAVNDYRKFTDLLLLHAVFEKNRGHYNVALTDIEDVYKLHKDSPTEWKLDSAIFL